MKPYFQTAEGDFALYGGDAREVVPEIPAARVGMVFADPPYFLSNGGFSVQAGRRVCVIGRVRFYTAILSLVCFLKHKECAVVFAFHFLYSPACRDQTVELFNSLKSVHIRDFSIVGFVLIS